MKAPSVKPVRCAIYTRVSTEHGLDQEFNSLDAQYEAASAYIKSQAHAGWTLIRYRYDDGGYSGGSTIVIAVTDQGPAGMGLALDIGRGRLVLRVQRVELLVEAMLGRNPRIDRAADRLD